jgi:uncharacterized protein YdeI (BOF family)
LRDDYPVVLRGKIERFLGDEKYLFTNETGSIIVEMDNRLWQWLSVDQNGTLDLLKRGGFLGQNRGTSRT